MSYDLAKAVASIDWEFEGTDTQYLTHNIHRYSGKFIPQIAKTAIELLSVQGDTVLDSYMGSGTTLLEARLLDRNSIGVDLNPLAILISSVKNMTIEKQDISEIEDILIPYVTSCAENGQLSFVMSTISSAYFESHFKQNKWRLDTEWNKKWYQPDVLAQLVELYSCVESLSSEKARKIAYVAFSNILRKSSNASSRYPNVMYDKNAKARPLPARAFKDELKSILLSVCETSSRLAKSSSKQTILEHNNLALPIANDSIDAIVTHPPYIAAIPYAEYGCLSLNWLGYDSKELDSKLTGGKRHSAHVVTRFAEDYRQYFVESHRVLKRGKYMFIMVGNPVAHGEKITLDQLSIDFADEVGFTHIVTAIRKGQNRRGNKMGEEYLIFFQKK